MKNAIPENWIAQDKRYHSNSFMTNVRIIYATPARMKAIPPTISYFQDIQRTAIKMNTGILCIKNATTVPQKPKPVPKTSRDIRAKNAMKMIDTILGAQYTNLLTFFFMGSKPQESPSTESQVIQPVGIYNRVIKPPEDAMIESWVVCFLGY